jgi:hypothetical protein
MLAVAVLLLPAELERSRAQVRQGQRSLRSFGLGLTAQELAADALELLADVQFRVIEADLLPGEASVSQNFEVDGLRSPVPITAWLRPLEFYAKALQESGFVITGLSEPHPSGQLLRSDDWWRTSFPRPLFMLIVAQRWPR